MIDDRDVLRAEALDEVLRPTTEPSAARDLGGHLATVRRDRAHELLAAEHSLQLVATLRVVERDDARVRRVALDLLDAEMLVGDARDLRQMRDRQHLRALTEAAQDVGDAMRGDASDAGVDLVEDDGLASRDRGDRERDARELSARRRLGDGRERQPGVRTDEEHRLVRPGRPRLALPQLDMELALTHPEIDELARDRLGERLRRDATGVRERLARSAEAALRVVSRSASARSSGSPPAPARSSSWMACERRSSNSSRLVAR